MAPFRCISGPDPRRGRATPAGVGALLLLGIAGLGACGGPAADHPWLSLEDGPPHRIVEVSGNSAGQLVIVMEPTVSPTEVLDLGERIVDQAPPGTTVNARIFNDEQTARNWRTAPGEWTREHLLAVVTVNPETGVSEVRWMRPEPGTETVPGGVGPDGMGTPDPMGAGDPAAPGSPGPPPTPPEPVPGGTGPLGEPSPTPQGP